MSVAYLDGVLPSVVIVRGAGGDNTPAFAFDYRNGKITERWRWIPKAGEGLSQAHNISIFDLDNDGKDEIAFLGSALDDNGKVMYDNHNFTHGDHYRVLDMDPDRPGYEIFSIQQNNSSLIGMSIHDGLTGDYFKKWFMSSMGDLSRGDAGDYDATVKGAECYSTMGGLYNCKGDKISATGRFPVWGIWWNSDLQRELIDGVNASGTSPAIERWPESRLYSVYADAGSPTMPYGGHPPLWADILGDWREEMVLETADRSELRIYTTYDPAINRLYTLMQNPGYRGQTSCRGRIGGSFPDYYLGSGMQTPPPPPMVNAKLHWKGNAGSNIWDVNTSQSWLSGSSVAGFAPNDSVLFDLTGLNTTPVTLTGVLNPGQVTVYSPNDYTFGGTGRIAGATSLTKVGKGFLMLNNKNTYTGKTVVWDGALIVNDSLSNSDVTVYGGTWGGALSGGLTGGRIGGHGIIGKSLTLEYGGAIIPGDGVGSVDTLTVNNLTEKLGAVNFVDLSKDPTGVSSKSDIVNIKGNLILSDSVTISVGLKDAVLSAGFYPVLKYAGSFIGSVSKIKVIGLSEYPFTVVNQNNAIGILIAGLRPAAKVVWAGTSNLWDLGISNSWLKNGVSDVYATRDSVLFDNTGSLKPTITLNKDLYASDLTFDGITNYTINGAGAICGDAKLTKKGTSVVRLTGKHKFTGNTLIEAGTLEIGSLDDAGEPSSIGSALSATGGLEIKGGAGLSLVSLSSSTNRQVAINGGECTFSSISGSSMSLLSGVSGTGTLVKAGAGILQLNAANTYTGGTVVKAGKIVLGSSNANRNGLGSGNVTLDGGALYMINVQMNDVFSKSIYVPTGSTGEFGIDGRCNITSTLTGGGTFTVYSPYVRGDLSGDWSAFTGTINATGVDFRINNNYGYANATLNAAADVNVYKNSAGTVNLGQLSGEANSNLTVADWVVGSKNTDAVFNGKIISNSLTKVGTGSLTLTDTCTNTVVNGGKIILSNNGCIKGTLIANAGGTFMGTGATLASVSIAGGTIQPGGTSYGTLKIGGSLILNSASKTIIRINKTAKLQDSIRVKVAVTIAGTLNLNLTTGSFISGDSVKVINSPKYSGKFNAIVPETPGNGLVWDQSSIAKNGYIKVIALTAVDNTWADRIELYPNPVKDILTVKLGDALSNGQLSVLTLGGAVLYNQEIGNQWQVKVDMSIYSSGVYILKLNNKDNIKLYKFVKR
jgi:autotransporter-associated beta strand protein